MKSHILIGLFTAHSGDLLSGAICEVTRGKYCHACFITNPATLEIAEQFEPHFHFRNLSPAEAQFVEVFSISGWTDHQDAALRMLLAQRNADQVPYWANGLLKFIPQYRALDGEATAADWAEHAFCSMEVFEDVRLQGSELLRANCWEVHPVMLGTSPLLNPEPKLEAAA